MRLPQVAVVSDLREERWHSMDLVAEMLLFGLRTPEPRFVEATEVRPRMTRRLTRLLLVGATATADTADRILNRVWDYPRWLRDRTADFDLFHIVDHSYAHLATRLPAGRAVVTCHDLDAFRGVLPGPDRGAIVQRALGRRLLDGMRAARKILCVSAVTRDELVATAMIPPERVVVVPNGVHPACSPRPDVSADREAVALLGPVRDDRLELLHVGSTIPRKRLDVLLDVVAAVRETRADVCLVQLGGTLTAAQRRQAAARGLDPCLVELPFVNRRVLAAVYRRAALLLQTSEREGFGLPVAEALTCGTPVVASDLAVMHEVGGPSTTYCPVGDVARWAGAVLSLLNERECAPARWQARRDLGFTWAQRFTWQAHARATLDIYRELLSRAPTGDALPGGKNINDEGPAHSAPGEVLSPRARWHGNGAADAVSR